VSQPNERGLILEVLRKSTPGKTAGAFILSALLVLLPARFPPVFVQSGLTGQLHCVPMIVKDNFETKGLQTSDGALAFAGYQPKEDATQVARVKAAGAIVLAGRKMLNPVHAHIVRGTDIHPREPR